MPICQRVLFAEGDRKKNKMNKSFCLLADEGPMAEKKAPSLYSLKLILLKKSFLLQKTGVKMKSIVQKIMIFRPNTFKINLKMYSIKSKTNFVKQ